MAFICVNVRERACDQGGRGGGDEAGSRIGSHGEAPAAPDSSGSGEGPRESVFPLSLLVKGSAEGSRGDPLIPRTVRKGRRPPAVSGVASGMHAPRVRDFDPEDVDFDDGTRAAGARGRALVPPLWGPRSWPLRRALTPSCAAQ